MPYHIDGRGETNRARRFF